MLLCGTMVVDSNFKDKIHWDTWIMTCVAKLSWHGIQRLRDSKRHNDNCYGRERIENAFYFFICSRVVFFFRQGRGRTMENAFYNPLPNLNGVPRWQISMESLVGGGEREFDFPSLWRKFLRPVSTVCLLPKMKTGSYILAQPNVPLKDEERINCLIPSIITQFPNKKFKINPNITEDQHKDWNPKLLDRFKSGPLYGKE